MKMKILFVFYIFIRFETLYQIKTRFLKAIRNIINITIFINYLKYVYTVSYIDL